MAILILRSLIAFNTGVECPQPIKMIINVVVIVIVLLTHGTGHLA